MYGSIVWETLIHWVSFGSFCRFCVLASSPGPFATQLVEMQACMFKREILSVSSKTAEFSCKCTQSTRVWRKTPTNISLQCRHTRAWRFTIHNFHTSLLQVLCIHLKRFRFTSCVRTKLSLPVSFPLSGLDVGQFTVAGGRGGGGGEMSSVYDLAAVVVHHGSG